MRKITRALTAATAAGVLALAGCGGGDDGGSSGGSSSKSGKIGGDAIVGDADTPGTQVNGQPREKLKQGGELKLSIGPDYPANWNGLHLDGNQVDINNILGFVSPALFDIDHEGKPSPNENYLLEFEESGEGEDFEVVLKLNPEAKWNDGTPISWEDFHATWEACNGENTVDDDEDTDSDKKFACASTDGFREVADITKGESDSDVVIDFKNPYPDWSGTFSTVWKKDSVKDPKTFNTGWKGDVPPNEWLSGPFAFDKTDKAQKRITLKPNPKWWGDKPLLDSISFYSLDANAVGNAFANKEIDEVSYIIDAPTLQAVKQRDDADVRMGTGKQWRHFTFNSKAGNLKDEKVRQAIAMGVDRGQIAKSALAGLPVDAEKVVLGNHFFMPGQEGYVDNSTDTTPYDPEKAGQLLDEAGWTLDDGKEFRTNDKGEELVVQYLMINGIPTSENEGKVLQDQMKKIGVNVKFAQTASNDFFPKVIAGDYEIAAFTWQGTPYPMANVDQIYGSKGGSNFAQLTNEKVDELIPQIAKETDHKKRIDLTNEADKAIWESVHTLPTYQRMELTAVPKKLANYGAFGLATGRPENIGWEK